MKARAGAASLHEAHVARRDLRVERQAELTFAAHAAPVLEQETEGFSWVREVAVDMPHL